ncbi:MULTISPECIES: 50S ribosomal protein L21 [Rhodomicrobium]|uniref:50S ribosomal protein L21 n=1 Tax=Rhodomicrobium TaxID=1068 RepID=UPI000B4B3405|nr:MULTISPECIES: 50S ribosomal protein L21 [Rhodomicrobium]
MYAVIRTGGKQYKVAPDDLLVIEKIPGEAGDIVEFGEVLMLAGDGEPQVGAPLISGATVAAELVDQHRGEKIIIFKKKRRQNYRRRNGHRQYLSTVRITEILTGGEKPKKSAAKAKPAADAAPKRGKPAAAGFQDDVKLIGGVGPALEKKLAALGVTSLKQIAAFTPAEIERIDTELSFKGRIEREEWVQQAKDLIAGKPPRAKVDQDAADKSKK